MSGNNVNNLDMIDAQLISLELIRKEIPKDGACMFRCISEFIYGCQQRHQYIRAKCIEYLKAHRDNFEPFACFNNTWEHYIDSMSKDDTWGGEIELQALSLYYKVNFIIYVGHSITRVDNQYPTSISLAYCQGEHYDLVYPISHMNNLKMVQSLIYNILAESSLSLDTQSHAQQWRNNSVIGWEEETKAKQLKDKKIAETLLMNKRVYINPVEEYQLKQKKKQQQPKQPNTDGNNNRSINKSGEPAINTDSPNVVDTIVEDNSNKDIIYPAMENEEIDEELRAIIKQIELQDLEEQRQLGHQKHFPTLHQGGNKQQSKNSPKKMVPSPKSPAPIDSVPTSPAAAQTTATKTASPAPSWGTIQDWSKIEPLPIPATSSPTTTPTALSTSSDGSGDHDTPVAEEPAKVELPPNIKITYKKDKRQRGKKI
ncbi:hypothetical protein SAMD00019534_011360 [Acytostelium subglobosum LB1]|uniref:hypothetical protein n=1 Tax=Acytostelium subglobosum LB1 TaxID=1410327 RepID=UPI000644C922|nr:hypothetical protein SAMD00019534_011360 [Acytostelium subglobosum LB1]GAM17961.1 hypothetical protein SAMD00019534_011360 [Acytostelium subglobosum LB1]|eukprot:XP_012758557.1 hypothetical protein SAMD00019534_011360 [Acytostelium subglobosum LB1]